MTLEACSFEVGSYGSVHGFVVPQLEEIETRASSKNWQWHGEKLSEPLRCVHRPSQLANLLELGQACQLFWSAGLTMVFFPATDGFDTDSHQAAHRFL